MDVDGRPRGAGQLASGSVLAGYRIEATLGRGGMGVVYLATDLQLERPVALKVLASEWSAVGEARARFSAESRLAASLDHPNIAAVYGSGEEGGHLWIAMRYVDGSDLRKLIGERGRLDPDVAVTILTQIANALDAAHARGLVHRDVKPSNILIARPGTTTEPHAFLVDFGLTKGPSDASTRTLPGRVLGSVDYVSPEQIEGAPVDGRADQYALAAVLFTALTGEPPFHHEVDLATINAHLKRAPPAISDFRPDLPDSLDAVVGKALSKDARDRYPSTISFMRAVRDAIGPVRSAAPATVPPTDAAAVVPIAATPRKSKKRRAWIAVAVALVLIAGGIAVAAPMLTESPVTSGSVIAVSPDGNDLTTIITDEFDVRGLALSEDGRRIAYITDNKDRRRLYIADSDGSDRILVDLGTANARTPAWSPAGDKVAFIREGHGSDQVVVVGATGSGVLPLTTGKVDDSTPAWSPNGSRIAFTRAIEGEDHLFVMEADGSDPRDLTKDGHSDRSPAWSPDGQTIAISRDVGGHFEVYLIAADGSSEQSLVREDNDALFPRWSPSGDRIIYVAARPTGGDIVSVTVADGQKQRLTGSLSNEGLATWSPDGTSIAFARDDGGRFHIYVMSSDGSDEHRVTDGPGSDSLPTWSSDGRVYFLRNPPIAPPSPEGAIAVRG